MHNLLTQLQDKKSRKEKSLAVLIDPDKATDNGKLIRLINLCIENKVDYILVGGSLIANDTFSKVISNPSA